MELQLSTKNRDFMINYFWIPTHSLGMIRTLFLGVLSLPLSVRADHVSASDTSAKVLYYGYDAKEWCGEDALSLGNMIGGEHHHQNHYRRHHAHHHHQATQWKARQ